MTRTFFSRTRKIEPVHVHYLQHYPIENPGFILDWAMQRGDTVTATHFYRGEQLSFAAETIDFLVVMGGPMNIYQHRDHPWLPEEKRFIRAVVEKRKPVLGICLGAQLIADVLGARVYQNPEIEIGWFPVEFGPHAAMGLPESVVALHWHGDTFEIPAGAHPLGRSNGCARQGFVYNRHVVGLQFHLEVNASLIENFTQAFTHELQPSPFVQSVEEILAGQSHLPEAHRAMETILNRLLSIEHTRDEQSH